jgi:uncharacterized protein
MGTPALVIEQTKKWITDVVVGCNFCPMLLKECEQLDQEPQIETSFLILPNAFPEFDKYLNLVIMAEKLLNKQKYEGVYQVASFHPLYCFEGVPENDAANYTNRSPYPMLHLLREERIEQALARYPNPEQIPERNIHFARQKGEVYMKMLRDACLK